MNKYFKLNLTFLLLLCLCAAPVYSKTNKNTQTNTKTFSKILPQSHKEEVKIFFKNHTKYSNKHELENLRDLYSDNYLNSDGFDKQTYFDMVSKTWSQYPSVSYFTIIRNIDVEGDYAVVEADELAYGSTEESFENIKGRGLVQSYSSTFYYLQKIGKNWKITSCDVINETTALKYGDAKKMDFALNAPSKIKAGQDYTSTLNVNIPSNTFILASISSEPITYPQKQPIDVFRTVKKDGILERMFTANKDHCNEYSIASIGITKASIVDKKTIDLRVTGMAFIMKRINIIDEKQLKQVLVSKDKKEDSDKI